MALAGSPEKWCHLATDSRTSRLRMTMHMWFWFDANLGSFLFRGYEVTSVLGLLATCAGLLSLAVIYEAMKVFQMRLHKRTVSSMGAKVIGSTEDSSLLTQQTMDIKETVNAERLKWIGWVVEVLHWSVHTSLGYVLMLAVMTYNAYVALAIVAGASLGYWLFGMTVIEMNLQEYREARYKITKCDPECADSVENEEQRASTASNISPEERVVAAQVNAEVHGPDAS